MLLNCFYSCFSVFVQALTGRVVDEIVTRLTQIEIDSVAFMVLYLETTNNNVEGTPGKIDSTYRVFKNMCI